MSTPVATRCVLIFLGLTITAAMSPPSLIVQDAITSSIKGPGVTVTNHSGYNTRGFLAVVDNPVDHFRVLYPHTDTNLSCAGYQLPSVAARKNNCVIATNGSPFVMHLNASGSTCLGDTVSNGSIITSQPTSVVFGMTEDNKFVMGDITSEQVKSMQVRELLSGFQWLVEQGTISTIKSGGEIAPRTVIGTDRDGRLLIFEADGIEDKDVGLTLLQTATWIQSLGGYNIINLDGGGSSVFVNNGKIYNHPTCIDTPAMCERPVTTVPCITNNV
eukprot:m.106243 g.106243  ORF g.106243 m.106243 type:complete len:273 (-) comp27706_c0_seq1:84-902(-)